MNPLQISRRQALQSLAAVPALGRAFGAASSHHMYLSLNSTPVTNRVPWPQFAELASKVGFPGVDVMLDPAMKAGVDATNKLLRNLKVRPSIINAPVEFRKDDAAFKASLPKLDAAAPFAAAIDCPRMMTYIMPSSETPKDELRRIYKQRFTECGRILAKSNVRLGLEFLGPLQFWTIRTCALIAIVQQLFVISGREGFLIGKLRRAACPVQSIKTVRIRLQREAVLLQSLGGTI